MDWNDVDDILYDGSREDIEKLACPDCGKKIQYDYFPSNKMLQIKCSSCGYLSKQHGGAVPNCYKLGSITNFM